DRVGADFNSVLEEIREKLKANPLAIQLPIGAEDTFTGLVDLVRMKAYVWAAGGNDFAEAPIPSEMEADVNEARAKLMDAVTAIDDALAEKFIMEEPISEEEIVAALRKGTVSNTIVPVVCGASFKNIGVQALLDAVTAYLPSPLDVPPMQGHDVKDPEKLVERKPSDTEPFSALAFKIASDPHAGVLTFIRVYSGKLEVGKSTHNPAKNKKEKISKLLLMHANKREEISSISTGEIAAVIGLRFTATGDTLCDETHPVLLEKMDFPEPVISMAIEPKTQADTDKLRKSLDILTLEDPTFRVTGNEETGQLLISGMGELHLEIIKDRLLREFRVDANVGSPQVSYRESISATANGESVVERVMAGKSHFGHVVLKVIPKERTTGFEFANEVS
ncbi:MAG: elongation factor G, partial [Proteobacteria bacterium]